MIKLEPLLTEKSLKEAKEGRYTFMTPVGLTKFQIKEIISKSLKVTVKRVRVVKVGEELKRSGATRHLRQVLATKKAIVTIGDKDKIDLFEEVKKPKKKKK